MLVGEIAIYILTGVLAGGLAGLLGIGGGIVTAPALIFIFRYLEIPQDILMQLAIGTSLSAMLVNTLFSFISHARHERVLWRIFRVTMPGLIIGTCFGAALANNLPGSVLKTLLGVFECTMAICFVFSKQHPETSAPVLHFPTWTLSSVGLFIGSLAALLGISGGQITLPLLSFFRIPMLRAIGTSSAISFVVSLTGSCAYMIPNLSTNIYRDTIGLVYLPAFIPISIVCFFVAPQAAKLCGVIPSHILKRIFSSVLFFTGLALIIF